VYIFLTTRDENFYFFKSKKLPIFAPAIAKIT